MKSSILSIFFLILGWNSIDASPVGAPGAACSTMVPSHGVTWQERDCPFEILLDTVKNELWLDYLYFLFFVLLFPPLYKWT